MSDTPYRIIEIHTFPPSLVAAEVEARRQGRFPLLTRASEWIMSELVRTPSEFGESGHYWPFLQIQGRFGFAGPLFVDFGVDEDHRLVYLRRFVWSADRAADG